MRLDMYDDFPSGMRSYLKAYGWHFSKAMCDWAVSMMEKEDGNGKKVKITPFTKEQVDEMLKKYSVDVKKRVDTTMFTPPTCARPIILAPPCLTSSTPLFMSRTSATIRTLTTG